MKRHSGRSTSLWEVMSKNKLKESQAKVRAQFLSKQNKPEPEQQQPTVHAASPPQEKPEPKPQWSSRPAMFQTNEGRVELSLPYAAAVLFTLTVVVALLVAFRVGQEFGGPGGTPAADSSQQASASDGGQSQSRADVAGSGSGTQVEPKTDFTVEGSAQSTVSGSSASTSGSGQSAFSPDKDHVIIIAVYQIKRDLEPVRDFFNANGMPTEIVHRGNWYYLQTKNRYDSPLRRGSDGYYALQQVKRIGKKYDAPKGYESFKANQFQDAYGMNIEKR